MKDSQKKRIFNTLLNYKFKYFVLNYISARFFKIDRNLNVFLAFAASGSVATWIIWEKLPILWAGIIVASQIVNVVKPFFPYSKYAKQINEKQNQLKGVLLNFEILWNKIQNNKVDDDKAMTDFFQLKKDIEKILTFPYDTVFSVNKNIKHKANLKMKYYLKRNYDIEVEVN
ncbi:hypothetical protein SAMN05444280_12242 [Tangfeifania diversioriginum]|uniref:SMODS and SLOG-associating 2TM effector domain-containing protein n=1 Tax=Tangfeifania diversioriginum TaxID=1168035 RepID=A0A1M6K5C2_9BACT|nr:hypothetical protein [Tangfeifania diversioriginum]SHJ54133.1 hypothetical protein SAMN05444280_12242 [Tangfeifania diversioriginum]